MAANGECGEECPFKNTNVCDNDLYAVEALALDLIKEQKKTIDWYKVKNEMCELIAQSLHNENKRLKAELERIRDEESEEDYK